MNQKGGTSDPLPFPDRDRTEAMSPPGLHTLTYGKTEKINHHSFALIFLVILQGFVLFGVRGCFPGGLSCLLHVGLCGRFLSSQ